MKRTLTGNPEVLDLFFAKMEDSSLVLTEPQQQRYDRLYDTYTHWLQNPILPDNRVRDYIVANYGVTKMTAYQDIAIIKCLFGSVQVSHKEMQRVKANHLFDMAAAAAVAGNTEKAKTLTKIAEGIVKANRLDDAEKDEVIWTDIVPKDFSLTVDPSVIGIEPVPGIKEKAEKLLKRYTADIDGDDGD